ncbi:MAG: phosphatase PAP2 family protein [Nitrospinae bacterium]|nr:phosphatase PAP2 family protein [Nitrospinota bacterium]
MESLRALDEALFLLINNGLSNPVLDVVMTFASVAGDAPGWIIGGIAGIFYFDRANFKRRAVTFLLLMAAAGLLLNVTKNVFERDRPLEKFKQRLDAGEVIIHTPYNKLWARSFPSGHSQAAFTAATFFALYYRRFQWALFGTAALVALSRVYVGAHFPADIVAGSLFGWLMAYIWWRMDPQAPRPIQVAEVETGAAVK